MTSEIIKRVISMLGDDFTNEQIHHIQDIMYVALSDCNISLKETAVSTINRNDDADIVKMFFVAKKVEGCTNKTLNYYKTVLKIFFKNITIPIRDITTDNIRYYIAKRGTKDGLSKVSQDNERRVLQSFFRWLAAEEYIIKNPMNRINSIKKEKRIKKAFTEIEIEKLRQAADCRELAIIEFLLSTGVRVSECEGVNISDINGDECIVYGKGEKERYVYLNAKATLSLQNYINSRSDKNNALFVGLRAPFKRLSKSSIEKLVHNLGDKAGISKCHPHRFRRTAAQMALNRGMPLEQVQQMLGHSQLQTTTLYAQSERSDVKASHKKFVI